MKEVDLAITADMGTLQRLPGIVGDGALKSNRMLSLDRGSEVCCPWSSPNANVAAA